MSKKVEHERLQWPDLDLLDIAKQDGDYAPLADYLRTDYPLHSDTRDWLARLLMDELPARKSGNPKQRTPPIELWRVFETVVQRMDKEGISQEQALCDYAEAQDETLDAVRSRYKRARKRWSIIE